MFYSDFWQFCTVAFLISDIVTLFVLHCIKKTACNVALESAKLLFVTCGEGAHDFSGR